MITEDVDCKMHHILVSKIEKKKKRNGVSEFRKCRNRKNLDTEINTGHVL